MVIDTSTPKNVISRISDHQVLTTAFVSLRFDYLKTDNDNDKIEVFMLLNGRLCRYVGIIFLEDGEEGAAWFIDYDSGHVLEYENLNLAKKAYIALFRVSFGL